MDNDSQNPKPAEEKAADANILPPADNLADTNTPSPLEGPASTQQREEGGGEVNNNLADTGTLAPENPEAPAPDTNSEFPATPETPLPAAEEPASNQPNSEYQPSQPSQTEPSPEPEIPEPAPTPESQPSQPSQQSQPTCPPLTIDSPAFKDLLKIYLSGFVLARRAKRDRNLALILESFGPLDKITNNQVETLLKVSDRTATAYLTALFKQGKLMRFGKGHKTFYQKTG